MPATYDAIATTTLSSTTHSFTFSSIPQTYTDLILVQQGSITVANGDAVLQFNGDAANNYSRTYIYGSGSSAGYGRNAPIDAAYGTYWNTNPCNAIWHIMNYSSTSVFKAILTRNNSVTTPTTYTGVGTWRSTSAITSIACIVAEWNKDWVSGTTFTLYGIKAA